MNVVAADWTSRFTLADQAVIDTLDDATRAAVERYVNDRVGSVAASISGQCYGMDMNLEPTIWGAVRRQRPQP